MKRALLVIVSALVFLPGAVGCGTGDEAEQAIALPDGRKLVVVAGNGIGGFAGDRGPATEAQLNLPYYLAWDTDSNLYIGQDYRISRVDAESGVISTIAGTGRPGYSGDGGPATKAKLQRVQQLAFDSKGRLFFTEWWSDTIRRVGTDGVIVTVAGSGVPGFSPDGTPAAKARLDRPFGLAFGPDGKLYFSDGDNHRVRRIEPDGTIATMAGTGEAGEKGDGGPATKAQLAYPRGLVFDREGNLYIGTHGGSGIRRVDVNGIISTVVETGGSGLTLDADGNMYIADYELGTISKWSARDGLEVVLEQGKYERSYIVPSLAVVDAEDNVFISDDRATHRIYRLER